MNRKLTLTIDTDVIIKAKEYASKTQTSISRLVEDYLFLLTMKAESARLKDPPVSNSIRRWGCGITSEDLQIDESDPKMAYLADKYLHV